MIVVLIQKSAQDMLTCLFYIIRLLTRVVVITYVFSYVKLMMLIRPCRPVLNSFNLADSVCSFIHPDILISLYYTVSSLLSCR